MLATEINASVGDDEQLTIIPTWQGTWLISSRKREAWQPANHGKFEEFRMKDIGSYLTLAEVSQSVQLSVEAVISIVHSGIVEPQGDQPQRWLFEPKMVKQIRRAFRLQQDLDLDWPAVALAIHLNEDLNQLREQNRRLRLVLRSLSNPDITR